MLSLEGTPGFVGAMSLDETSGGGDWTQCQSACRGKQYPVLCTKDSAAVTGGASCLRRGLSEAGTSAQASFPTPVGHHMF